MLNNAFLSTHQESPQLWDYCHNEQINDYMIWQLSDNQGIPTNDGETKQRKHHKRCLTCCLHICWLCNRLWVTLSVIRSSFIQTGTLPFLLEITKVKLLYYGVDSQWHLAAVGVGMGYLYLSWLYKIHYILYFY